MWRQVLPNRRGHRRTARGADLSDEKKRLAILISGRGSNMLALHDASQAGKIANADIAVGVSDKSDARGLALAQERGIEAIAVERRGRNRDEHKQEIIGTLRERR